MKKLLFFITFALFVSCSAEKRLQNLLDKHPELMQTDTIRSTIRDTIVKPETTFEYNDRFFVDTIYKVDTVGVTTFVQVTKQGEIKIKTVLKADTIYIEKQVIQIKKKYTPKPKPKKPNKNKIKCIAIIIIFGFFIFVSLMLRGARNTA